MNETVELWTDGAMLVVFDPEIFADTSYEPSWPPDRDEAVRKGLYVCVGLQGDCTFRARFTDAGPTESEGAVVNQTLGPIGLVVRSGAVYVSGMDYPGKSAEVYRESGAGRFLNLAPGEYDVVVHEMDSLSQNWTHELPDFVVALSPRAVPFRAPGNSLAFTGGRSLDALLEKMKKERGEG